VGSIPGEYEYSSSKKQGPFKWASKQKMTIFSKTALRIFIKVQKFVETITLNKTEWMVSSGK
jgi:hypothetical protein